MPNPTKSSLEIVREAAEFMTRGDAQTDTAQKRQGIALARLVLAATENDDGAYINIAAIDRCAREIQDK